MNTRADSFRNHILKETSMTMTLTDLLDYLSGEIIRLTVDKAPMFSRPNTHRTRPEYCNTGLKFELTRKTA